jgi:hypothetical protein
MTADDLIRYLMSEGCSDAEITAYVGGLPWQLAELRALTEVMVRG